MNATPEDGMNQADDDDVDGRDLGPEAEDSEGTGAGSEGAAKGLSSKQAGRLRAMGQTLGTSLVVGKAGLSAELTGHLDALLNSHELVKVRLGEGGPADRKELVSRLEEATGSTCVGIVGRTALLYRPSPSLPPKRRIHLPRG